MGQDLKQKTGFSPLTVYGIFWPFMLSHSQLSQGHFLGNHSGLDCDVTIQNFKNLCWHLKIIPKLLDLFQ